MFTNAKNQNSKAWSSYTYLLFLTFGYSMNSSGMAKKAANKREENAKSLDDFPPTYIYISMYKIQIWLNRQLTSSTLLIPCTPFQPYLPHSS